MKHYEITETVKQDKGCFYLIQLYGYRKGDKVKKRLECKL